MEGASSSDQDAIDRGRLRLMTDRIGLLQPFTGVCSESSP